MPISEKITLIRGNESRSAFSKRLGIKENTLRNYEKGLSLPNSDMVARICELFGVSPHWILFGTGPMRPGELEEQLKQQPVTPQKHTPTPETCPRCAKLEAKLDKLEAKLDKVEQQRDELVAENKKLWQENGGLREEVATLRERQKFCCSGVFLEPTPLETPGSPRNNMVDCA